MKKICASSVAALLALAAPVWADVMTFDSPAGSSGSLNSVSYTEAGMTVTSLHSHPTAHLHPGFGAGGTLGLVNHGGCCSQPYRFDMGGSGFDLSQLEVTTLSLSANSYFEAPDGAKVFLSGYGTFTFSGPSWSNISSFLWHYPLNAAGQAGNTGIDNLVFNPNPVPEPATLALLGIGGVGYFVARKRRKAKA